MLRNKNLDISPAADSEKFEVFHNKKKLKELKEITVHSNLEIIEAKVEETIKQAEKDKLLEIQALKNPQLNKQRKPKELMLSPSPKKTSKPEFSTKTYKTRPRKKGPGNFSPYSNKAPSNDASINKKIEHLVMKKNYGRVKNVTGVKSAVRGIHKGVTSRGPGKRKKEFRKMPKSAETLTATETRFEENIKAVYDETIRTDAELNDNKDLVKLINEAKGVEDLNQYVSMADYEEWALGTALAMTINANPDIDAQELTQSLRNRGLEVDSDMIGDLIHHLALQVQGQGFDTSNIDLGSLSDINGIDEAFLAYTDKNLHFPGFFEVESIRKTSILTILSQVSEDPKQTLQKLSLDSSASKTTSIPELVEYIKERDAVGDDFVKNRRYEKLLGKVKTTRQQKQMHDLTKSLYVEEFSQPVHDFDASLETSGMKDTTELRQIGYNASHIFDLQVSDDELPGDKDQLELKLSQAGDHLRLENNIETKYLQGSGYLLRMNAAIDTKNPDSLALAAQQQIFLQNTLFAMNITQSTGLSDVQKEALSVFAHMGSTLSLSNLKKVNEKINDPDFALAMLHSDLDPLDANNSGSESDRIARNLTSFVRRWTLDRPAGVRGKIDEQFDPTKILESFDEFHDLTHTPDSSPSLEDKAQLEKKFPEYILKKLDHSSVCYLEMR